MSLFSSLHEAAAPAAAVEFSATRISGASLEWRGGQPVVTAHAVEPLPEGALVPSLLAANIHNRGAVTSTLERVLDQLGHPRRIGVIVPDVVAKVSLVRFEQVPPRALDLDRLIHWQVRKAAPFPIEEAQVSYVPGQLAADGQEFVVSLARRDVVLEYEELCDQGGAQAGIVDLATFNVVNAVLAGSTPPDGDWLLVNVAPDYATIAILRGPHLIVFRNRLSDTEGTLADLVHQTAMYYEDRLNGSGFSRTMLAGAAGGSASAGDVDQIRRSLEQRLGTTVENVDPRGAATLTDRISAAPLLLDVLAPLVGLLLRQNEGSMAKR
jgi:Tfp pilus assembly PilM family ATPase